MAGSVINSVRNILSDNFWWLKIIIYVLPVFYLINSNKLSEYSLRDSFIIVSLLSVIYLGILSFMMNSNINNKTPFLPGMLNIIDVVKDAIFTSILSLPLFAVFYFIIYYVQNQLHYDPVVMWTIYIAVSIILAPFLFIPSVLYSARRNFFDAFNFAIIFKSSGNFCVSFISYIIQYVFIILLAAFLVYQLLIHMLNDVLFLNILYSVVIVITVFSFYSYCSDLYGDVIDELPERKRKH